MSTAGPNPHELRAQRPATGRDPTSGTRYLTTVAALVDMAVRKPGALCRDCPLAEDMQRRIHAMAVLHSCLAHTSQAEQVDMSAYLAELVGHMRTVHGQQADSVQIELVTGPIGLEPERAGLLGLISVELVDNSLRHAFPDEGPAAEGARIQVQLRTIGPDRLALQVADNGIGRQAAGCGNRHTQAQPNGGMELVELLARQLGGRCADRNRAGVECDHCLSPRETGQDPDVAKEV